MRVACRCLAEYLLDDGAAFACQGFPYDLVGFPSRLGEGPSTKQGLLVDPCDALGDPLAGEFLAHFHSPVEAEWTLAHNHLCAEDVASGSLIDEEIRRLAEVAAAAVVAALAVIAGDRLAAHLGQCSCLEYDLTSLQDCSGDQTRLAGSQDVEGTEDGPSAGLEVPRDYAAADTDQDCLLDLAVLADSRIPGTETLVSNFLVNTEIGVGMGPSYRLHVAAYVAMVDLDSLALAAVRCFADQDLSFVPLTVHLD